MDFTLHQMHTKPQSNCENCSYYGSMSYQIELRKNWFSMVEKYPNLYSMQDYLNACEAIEIPIF